mgnify:FL=1
MRKVFIGSILFIGGMIGTAILVAVAGIVPADGWVTPPGRFVCTVLQNGTAFPLLISLLLLVGGFIILAKEYFKKEN